MASFVQNIVHFVSPGTHIVELARKMRLSMSRLLFEEEVWSRIITPTKEAEKQRITLLNAQLGAANKDVLNHLRNIRKGFNICDSRGKVETTLKPWRWVMTDNHGNTKGADRRKEIAVHEAGHCVSAFLLGDYPTKARVNKSRSAKRTGYFNSLSSINGFSVEEVKRTVESGGFTHEQALLSASFQVIGLCAGVEAAIHVGGLLNASEMGFNDEWHIRNILVVFPGLDVSELRSLAAALVVYYADAVKSVAKELYEKSQLETRELLRAVLSGFGPEFPVHPRVRWGLKYGPHCAWRH